MADGHAGNRHRGWMAGIKTGGHYRKGGRGAVYLRRTTKLYDSVTWWAGVFTSLLIHMAEL